MTSTLRALDRAFGADTRSSLRSRHRGQGDLGAVPPEQAALTVERERTEAKRRRTNLLIFAPTEESPWPPFRD